ncbi:hypothetical protein DL95DRAFT_500171 [Leptodontidium sp. 2 PMI_412]|nr:hypothetical protein DL95DRAFT_500171 [Leptodontidium sp. 2 PMI_412]
MSKIYRTCSLCIIWLGESAVWTDQAFTIVRWMASGEHVDSWNLDHSSPGTPVMPQDNSLQFTPFKDGLFAHLKYLSQRSWWSRTWTVQELVLPDRVLMKCGSHEVDWNLVSAAYTFLDNHLLKCGEHFCRDFRQEDIDSLDAFKSAVYPLVRSCNSYDDWVHYQRLSSNPTPIDIIALLVAHRKRQASDPRDKVYGFLSLCSVDFQQNIHVNYSSSLLDCYAEPTLFDFKSSRGLRTLGLALRDETGSSLPSWVPDWSSDTEEAMYSADRLGRYDLFSAAGDRVVIYSSAISSTDHLRSQNTLTSEGRELAFSTHPCILSLRGVHRQTIILTGDYTTQFSRSNSLAIMKSWLKMWKLACKPAATSESDNSIPSTLPFIRTILRDSVQPSNLMNRPRRATEADYVACLRWWNLATETQSISLSHTTEDEAEATQLADILWSLPDTVGYSRFFVTDKGSIGLGPTSTKPGDEIWIVSGGKLPLILRENKNPRSLTGEISIPGTYHTLVGDCYVDGIMDREATGNFPIDAGVLHIV